MGFSFFVSLGVPALLQVSVCFCNKNKMLTCVHVCTLTINVLAVLSRSINAAIVAVWVVCERCGGAEIGSILLGGGESAVY